MYVYDYVKESFRLISLPRILWQAAKGGRCLAVLTGNKLTIQRRLSLCKSHVKEKNSQPNRYVFTEHEIVMHVRMHLFRLFYYSLCICYAYIYIVGH